MTFASLLNSPHFPGKILFVSGLLHDYHCPFHGQFLRWSKNERHISAEVIYDSSPIGCVRYCIFCRLDSRIIVFWPLAGPNLAGSSQSNNEIGSFTIEVPDSGNANLASPTSCCLSGSSSNHSETLNLQDCLRWCSVAPSGLSQARRGKTKRESQRSLKSCSGGAK